MSYDQKTGGDFPLSGNRMSNTDRSVRRVLLVEGSANLLILFLKAIVAFTSGSNAILGDAVHSLADVANNVVALVIAKVSASPPDREHPYGHRKFETLAVFILATMLSVMAIEISIRAIYRIGHPVQYSNWGLGLMIGVLLVNIVLASWESLCARRLQSNLLRADARHTFSDVFTTVAVIIGWILSTHGFPILDTVFTFLVSILVFYLAFDLFRRVIPILVDKVGIAPDLLERSIRSVPGVVDVRQVRSRCVERDIIADVVISVDPNLSTENAHNIADEIEILLSHEYGINDVSVHVEPDN